MRYLNIGLLLGVIFVLNGCLEVDDDSNDKVADSLNEQNQLLSEQLEQNSENSAPVTLYGTVLKLGTNAPIAEGKATLTVGDTTREPVSITDGRFEIAQVPANSNYELLIESTSGEFISRAFYGETRFAGSGFVFQDLDFLYVSPQETLSFSVKDAKTAETIDNLVFKASSHVGESSRSITREHRSTYNSESQKYSITIPKLVPVYLRANVDFDNDQEADFEPNDLGRLVGSTLEIASSSLVEVEEFSLVDLANPNYPEFEIRVSVVDAVLSNIENLIVNVSDDINGDIEATYDTATGQYVLNIFLKSEVSVLIPSFEQNGLTYQSSSIRIYPVDFNNDNQVDDLQVSISNTNNFDSFYRIPASSAIVDIAVSPRLVRINSNVDVMLKSSEISQDSNEFKVFYSSPIELLENSVSLVRKNVLQVTKGNESPDDLILPGTTLFEWQDIPIATTTNLRLNDTLLEITPSAPLAENFDYHYEIGTIKDVLTGIEADIGFEDAIEFSQKNTSSFDINTLVLDNDNDTTGGNTIVSQNTAGIASSVNNWDRSVYLYLPRSIEALEALTLVKVNVQEGNNLSAENQFYNIIGDSFSYINASTVYTVSLADNEIISNNFGFGSVLTGTALADGHYYRISVGEHMSDHTATETNKINFQYSYKTQGGDIQTGSLELEVK